MYAENLDQSKTRLSYSSELMQCQITQASIWIGGSFQRSCPFCSNKLWRLMVTTFSIILYPCDAIPVTEKKTMVLCFRYITCVEFKKINFKYQALRLKHAQSLSFCQILSFCISSQHPTVKQSDYTGNYMYFYDMFSVLKSAPKYMKGSYQIGDSQFVIC